MKKFAILFIICALAYACKSPQPLVQTIETVRTEREIVRDTFVKIEPDSAAVRAFFECDSMNNVVLTQLEKMQGERVKPTVKKYTTPKGMAVQIDCKEDSLHYEIQIRDKYIEELKNNTQQVPVRTRNAYDRFTARGFWVLLAIVLAFVGWKVAKIYLRIQSGGVLKL